MLFFYRYKLVVVYFISVSLSILFSVQTSIPIKCHEPFLLFSDRVVRRLEYTMAIYLRQGSGSAHLAQCSSNLRARPVRKHVLKTAVIFYRQSNTVCVLLLEFLRLTKTGAAIVYQHNQLQHKN